jgi:riboflavin kinase
MTVWQLPHLKVETSGLILYTLNHMKSSTVIRGRVARGCGESSKFTGLPWVREQFIGKLGIDPYPGTLNLEIVDSEDRTKWQKVKRSGGIRILPAEVGFCPATGFRVLINGTLSGAIVLPEVPNYPETKVEIIASTGVMNALSLNFGDRVEIAIFPAQDENGV